LTNRTEHSPNKESNEGEDIKNGAANGETTLFLTDVRINDAKTAIGGDVNHIGFEELR
jgi:hypothetical protein